MLVVGARGAGGFAAMMLGSVSRYAATRAACPVVVVREESMAVHREIAVGIRDPHDADGTLAFAFEEAALRGADLTAVHTWYWFPSALHLPAGAQELRPADPDQISAEAARSLAAALEGWRDKYPDVRVRRTSSTGIPPGSSRATPRAPTSWCSASTAIPPTPVPVSARSSTRSSTTPTAPSPSSPRPADAGANRC